MGQSKSQKAFNAQMAKNASDQLALQKEQFAYLKQGTPEEQTFRKNAASFQDWIGQKNYGAPPPNELLNFDLYTPSHVNELRSRLNNITGIGAAALGGTGDQSIALQQTRAHMADQAAQDAGQAYENAIHQADAYYKGNALGYAGLTTNTNMGLLNNATQSGQFFTDQQRQTLPKSFWETFAPVLGGVLGAGSSLLGNPSLFKP